MSPFLPAKAATSVRNTSEWRVTSLSAMCVPPVRFMYAGVSVKPRPRIACFATASFRVCVGTNTMKWVGKNSNAPIAMIDRKLDGLSFLTEPLRHAGS